MPILDARTLEADAEGSLLLGAVLHPNRRARERARVRSRQLLTTGSGEDPYRVATPPRLSGEASPPEFMLVNPPSRAG